MFGTRFTKMDLAIDDTWKDMKAGTIDNLSGAPRIYFANFDNPPAANCDVAFADTVLVDDDTILKKNIDNL